MRLFSSSLCIIQIQHSKEHIAQKLCTAYRQVTLINYLKQYKLAKTASISQQEMILLPTNALFRSLADIVHPFSTDYLFSIILFGRMSLSFQKSSFCYLQQKHITEPTEGQLGGKTEDCPDCSQEDIYPEEEEGQSGWKLRKARREVRHYHSRRQLGESFTIIINKVERVERMQQQGSKQFKGMFPCFTI